MRRPNEACDPAVVGPPNEPDATSPIASEVEPGDRHSAGDLGVSAQAALVRRREDGRAWAGPPSERDGQHGLADPGRTLEVHVASLRAKLRMPALIETVRGVGYRLVAPGA